LQERNASIVRRVVENIWNLGDLPMADRLFAAAYVNHGGLIPDLVHGPEAIKMSVALFRTAFPEFHITIEGITAEGDTVDMHWAADSGPPTVPATAEDSDRGGRLTGTTLSSLAAGKIVESWTDWDHVNALQRPEIVPLDTHA
jgi:predicted SnoaL-like aldol condensation-catalyzing enzyme